MLFFNIKKCVGFCIGMSLLLTSQVTVLAALPDFTKVVKEYGSAVVNISTVQKASKKYRLPKNYTIPDLPEDSPFGDLFKYFFYGDPNKEESPQFKESKSLGSGFVIESDGYIITNYHVVKDADEIIVRLQDRSEYNGEMIGHDSKSDIALLKIKAKNLPTVKVGISESLEVGEWVLAIGSPFGFERSVTAGIVSAKGRSLPSDNYVPFIQTDVAINPGNSGGPLFNMKGEVVGVNAQIFSKIGGGGYMGLSFAIPMDVAMDVVSQLKRNGVVERGWLGVLIQDVTKGMAETFGLDQPQGALVAKILPGSPAEKAGLQIEDVIVSYNGKIVNRSSSLPPLVGSTDIGSTVDVKVLRNGEYKMLKIKIGKLPNDGVKVSKAKPIAEEASRLGIILSDLTPEMRNDIELSSDYGVLVKKVLGDGVATNSGIKNGDVILKINGQPMKNVTQFNQFVKDLPGGRYLRIYIFRKGQPTFLALKLPKNK